MAWVKRTEVESHSDPNVSYVVAIDDKGNWGCSCWAWKKYRNERGDCKHISEVKAAGMLERTPDVEAEFERWQAEQRMKFRVANQSRVKVAGTLPPYPSSMTKAGRYVWEDVEEPEAELKTVRRRKIEL